MLKSGTGDVEVENLEIWNLALELNDDLYQIAALLPREEEYNLKSLLRRAATSIALNVAEGSSGQSNPEQNRFLGMALRSLLECVACIRLIQRLGYLQDESIYASLDEKTNRLGAKIQAFRRSIRGNSAWIVRDHDEGFEFQFDETASK